MATETVKILTNRLKDIDTSIDALRLEKAKVKQALELFKNSPEINNQTSFSPLKEPTFKEKVKVALSEQYKDGAAAIELLDYLNKNWKRPVKRESLSPQLSRLKNDDKIIDYDHSTGKWFLLKNDNNVFE